jgi:site-specific DNA-methyltransferase (cytosine-N4-specific)
VSKARLFWHEYKYFPYERELARLEVQTILGAAAEEDKDGLIVPLVAGQAKYLVGLTYFKGIEVEGRIIIPDQARLEASTTPNGNVSLPSFEQMPSLRRQNTRYSAHGLHEYRGKFNPQVVRAIGNLLGLEAGHWILDPFCGSGTTLLEGVHIGWNSVGLDVNPLGVLIANAKVAAIKTNPLVLADEAEALVNRLEKESSSVSINWREQLPNSGYLENWFAEPVLTQLAIILGNIDKVATVKLQEIFRVVLSDVCREVSLQDPGDLRIRRRKNPDSTYSVIPVFVDKLRSNISLIQRARRHLLLKKAKQRAFLADARFSPAIHRFTSDSGTKLFDAAITSPPYATALPYIDTQRLSLCLLGLIDSRQIRITEKMLIGNREISNLERCQLEKSLQVNEAQLPGDVFTFCKKLLALSDHHEHGFRKRNVPALVFKYFWQMAEMFESMRKVIRRDGKYALLVGFNKTTLNGSEVLIDTPQFLASVAASRGWTIEETHNFETYQRFDIHKKNSIRREVLLILRNAGAK